MRGVRQHVHRRHLMMLNHPAPGRHLPEGVQVADRAQAGQQCVDQRTGGKNVEQTALEAGGLDGGGARSVQLHSVTSIARHTREGNASCVDVPGSVAPRHYFIRPTGQAPCSQFCCVRLNSRGPVAQLVEQRTFNAWVAGSIPAGLTTPYPLLCLTPIPGTANDRPQF